MVPHSKSFGLKSFMFTGITLWNSLPNDIRKIDKLPNFKNSVKQFYFQSILNSEESAFIKF